MVRKVFESDNLKERQKYVAKELYDTFSDYDPQNDLIDTAFDIVCKYVSDEDCAYIEDNFLSEEAFAKVILKQPLSVLDKIEDDLSKVRWADYVKYADKDAFAEYERQMLDYYFN